MRLRVVENDDLYSTRMYDSPAAAWRGWSRIFYGCLGSLRRIVASAVLITLVGLFPWLGLAVATISLFSAASGSTSHWLVTAGAWAAVVVLMQFVVWREYATWRFGPAWSLTYFIGALVTLGILANAMLKTIGATPTTWRGTTYRGARMDRPRTAYNQRDTVRCLADRSDGA